MKFWDRQKTDVKLGPEKLNWASGSGVLIKNLKCNNYTTTFLVLPLKLRRTMYKCGSIILYGFTKS